MDKDTEALFRLVQRHSNRDPLSESAIALQLGVGLPARAPPVAPARPNPQHELEFAA